VDFPNFEDRWNFFQDCSKSGLLYWDSERLMQNIQDVENSKNIVTMNNELTNKTENPIYHQILLWIMLMLKKMKIMTCWSLSELF